MLDDRAEGGRSPRYGGFSGAAMNRNTGAGRTRLTAASPSNSARVVTISKYRMALPPMRPMRFISPPPAMPTTSVAKISGAMMERINCRNTRLTGESCLAKPGATIPRATPAAIPMKIQAVREMRFNARPTSASGEDVEEHHVRRATRSRA